MAELIPVEYRLQLATRQRVRLWCALFALTLAILGPVIGLAFVRQQRAAGVVEALRRQFDGSEDLIHRSEDLRAKRADLADRMTKIQTLMNDHVLLAVLNHISGGFHDKDALQTLHISTRQPDKNDGDTHDGKYFAVEMTGITNTTGTLAELMTRLDRREEPALKVSLETSNRVKFLDGGAVQFAITCRRGEPKS